MTGKSPVNSSPALKRWLWGSWDEKLEEIWKDGWEQIIVAEARVGPTRTGDEGGCRGATERDRTTGSTIQTSQRRGRPWPDYLPSEFLCAREPVLESRARPTRLS